MKRIFLCVVFFILVGCSSDEPTYLDNRGHKIYFSSYTGKWLVINYWAKWCAPCLHEVREFNRFSARYKNQVAVFGVSYDELNQNELKVARKKFKFNYPILQKDPAQQFKIGSISVVPMTVIINPQGHVIKKLYGPQTLQSLTKALDF